MLQIKSGLSQAFGPISGFGPQTINVPVKFPSPVTQATAILSGYFAEFSGNIDHHFGRLDVEVSVPPGGVNGVDVTVQVRFGLRDFSGDWDDAYDGQVFFSVIAE